MNKLDIDKINAETENVEKVISVIEKYSNREDLSELELAGLATYIHNFYNGVENIIKQILKSKNVTFKDSPSWHRDLLLSASENNIISEEFYEVLLKFLSFRHFFVHSYSFILDYKELKSLIDIMPDIWSSFKSQIDI